MREKMIMKGSMWTMFMHTDGWDLLLMAIGFIGSVGDGLAQPLLFYASSKLMNNLGTGSTGKASDALQRNLNQNAMLLYYLAAASFVLCFLEGYCWTRTAERQAARLRYKYMKAILRQEVEYFDLNVTTTSEIVTIASSDSLTIQDCISEKVPNFLMNIATFVGCYTTSFLTLWRFAIVGFPFLILLVVPGMIYGRTLMGLARAQRDAYNKAGNIVEQAVSCIRTVYAFGGETKTMLSFSGALEETVRVGLKQGLAKGLAIGSTGVSFVLWGVNSWYGSKLVVRHEAKGGTVFAATATLIVGGLALGSAISNLKYFAEGASAGERVMEVIKRVPKIDSENTEGIKLENVVGHIQFKHVHFAYPSRPESVIFQNLSLDIPAGKVVALVGGSGSGKSTVISLLQRFYNPLGGEILLDGVAIDNLQLKWLRAQMGLVSQEPALFATTIKENILFGKEDATLEEVVEAAKDSYAYDFVCQLPMGYDTQVGERGVQLSGGQKQRISIARAIIKRPRIVLLDEATSALDSESERVVQEAIDKATIGRTTVIIAHRLSTIRNANVIAVIQNGQVMEVGSHDELIQYDNGFYTSLVRLQKLEKCKNQDTSEPSNPSKTPSIVNNDIAKDTILSQSSSANSSSTSAHDHMSVNTKNQTSQAPSFRRLLILNLPEWKQASLGLFSALAYGAVQPIYAFVLGSMVSVYFSQDEDEIKSKAKAYGCFFIGLAILSIILNVSQHYNFAYMGEYLTKRVRERVLAKILTFEVGWFDQDDNSTGAVCSRLAKDANMVRSLVGDRVSLLAQTFSSVTLACIASLILAWRLALVMISAQPLIIFCFYTRRVLLKTMSKKATKAQDQTSKLAQEAVSNFRPITAFSSQARILKMLDQAQQGPLRESVLQSWYAGFGLGISQALKPCIWGLSLWYGGKLVVQHQINLRELFASFFMVMATGRIIGEAGSMTTDIAKGADSVGSIFAVLDRETRIEPESGDGSHPEKIMGVVEIRDVDFAYPARPNVMIFKGFSLKIEAGKSTALVGQSGSGKSTIIGLIKRFYDPTRGTVEIDGRDVRCYNLRSLRRHIALVSQEPTLFGGTIRENIVYGVLNVDESEIIEAAKAANAHEFITALKDGYYTWCGDKGVQLSGGQKQRIAIARAILKNPSMLLLDEATSALDSRSEKVVQDALERITVGRTSVIVAHRLSTIQNCDEIIVLDKGKLVEKGTHTSLLDKGPNGAYYSLVNLQRTHSDAVD